MQRHLLVYEVSATKGDVIRPYASQGWLCLCVASFVLQGEVITGSSPHGTCKRTKQVWLGQCSSQLLAPLGPCRCRGSAQERLFYWATAGTTMFRPTSEHGKGRREPTVSHLTRQERISVWKVLWRHACAFICQAIMLGISFTQPSTASHGHHCRPTCTMRSCLSITRAPTVRQT